MVADVGQSCYVLHEVVVVECLSELDDIQVLCHVQMNVDVFQNRERRSIFFCMMKDVFKVVAERIGEG